MTEITEPGQGRSREELIRERRSLIDEIHEKESEYYNTILDTLLTLPDNEVPAVLQAVKNTIMKLLPVTRETRGYLTADEIKRGARHKRDVGKAWTDFFEGLFDAAFKRCPSKNFTKDEVRATYAAIDERTYTSVVDYSLIIRHGDWKQEGADRVQNQEEYLRLIKEVIEALLKLVGADSPFSPLECLTTTSRHIARPKRDSYFDYEETDIAEIYEDIFIELLHTLKDTSTISSLRPGDLDETKKYLTALVTNSTQKLDDLAARVVSLAKDVERLDYP